MALNLDATDHTEREDPTVHRVPNLEGEDSDLQSGADVVNFSRKRELREQKNEYDKKSEHGSKRHRSARWPEQMQKEQESKSRHRVASPIRASRFHEESMYDLPSKKPPSLFTRQFNQHVSTSIDDLMEEYHESIHKPLPPRPGSRMHPYGHGTKSPERKLQALNGRSGVKSFDVAAPLVLGDPTEVKVGGIFKFGKSVASAFNPVNVWSKVASGWRAPKDESMEEAQDAQTRELVERQLKAEQAYAEHKRSGTLGMLGSRVISNGTTVFTPGYIQPVKDNTSQRDSAIAMDEGAHISVDTSSGSFLFPPDEVPRRSMRHGRTPSLASLKKIASEFNLHRRSSSASPEKHDRDVAPSSPKRSKSRGNIFELFTDAEGFGSLRGSKSSHNLLGSPETTDIHGFVRAKKEMAKQSKLSKRVSDLEAKLDSARRDLDRALGSASAVSTVNSPPSGLPLSRHERSDGVRGYAPGLPTLLSESLLVPVAPATARTSSGQVDDTKTIDTAYILHSDDEDESQVVYDDVIEDEPLREANGNSLYLHQNKALQIQNKELIQSETCESPPAKENVPGTPEKDAHLLRESVDPTTPNHGQTFLADPSSPRTESPKKPASAKKNEASKKSAPAKKGVPVKRKRPSKEDLNYRPSKDENDDDDELAGSKPKTLKKKRNSSERLTDSPKRSTLSRLPVATDSPKGNSKGNRNVLTKQAPIYAQKDLPFVPAPAQPITLPETDSGTEGIFFVETPGIDIHTTTGLATVHEEVSSSQSIPVKEESYKPTAKATPAYPHFSRGHRRSGSSSPVKSPTHQSTKNKTPIIRLSRDERSSSPPPSSSLGKMMSPRSEMNDSPIRVSRSPILRRSPGRDLLCRDDPVFTAKPNGRDVPFLPGCIANEETPRGSEPSKLVRKSSFEWPDDVF